MNDFSQWPDWQDKMLGRYRLVRPLGRGGMGEVWLAEDTQLRRQVAAKLLPIVPATDRTYLQDFEREARTAASLEHPHILPVHDFGDQPVVEGKIITYLITPYISGGSLADRIRAVDGPLPPDEAIRYLRHAAEAIDYAHSRNVLHRDIKPANMLLEQGWLLLADFGIAKLLTATTRGKTHAGAGTPDYMAPEHIQGKAEPASDRYSLACVAYQLSTGRLPLRGETPYETLLKQVTAPPPPPREFNPALPLAVEYAIMQGLAKNPAERPVSCVALVNAIERGWHMDVLSQPGIDPEATLLAPWSKRHIENRPTVRQDSSAALFPVGFVPVPGMPVEPGTPNAPTQYTPPVPAYLSDKPHTHYPPDAATYAADQPQILPTRPGTPASPAGSRKISRRGLLVGGGVVALAVAAGGTGLLYALAHARPGPVNTPALIPGPKKLIKGIPLLRLTGHSAALNNAVWDPSGRYLATAGDDTRVMLWDIGSYLRQHKSASGLQPIPTPLRSWKFSDTINADGLCWSADGRTLAAIMGINRKIFLVDATHNASQPVTYQKPDTSANDWYGSLSWSPKTNSFAVSRSFGQGVLQVELWQTNLTTAPLRVLKQAVPAGPNALAGEIIALGWSSDGTQVAGLTNYGQAVIWQAQTGTVKQVLKLPDRPNPPKFVIRQSLSWSPHNPHLLAVADLDIATVWDVQHNKLLLALKIEDPVPYITGLTWAPNGKYLAAGYARSPRVYVWDVQAPDPNSLQHPHPTLLYFGSGQLHTKAIFDAAWSPDGRYFASASADNTVIIWQVDA